MQDQNTPPVTPLPQTSPASQPANDPGRVMAILGIVFAVLPLQLIGLILSIIAKKKARPGSSTNTLSTVGIVLNAVFGVITAAGMFAIALTALSGIQNAATANAFLTAVQDGDIDKAASYTDEPNDAATKSFLRNAAAKVGVGHDQIDSAVKGDLQGFSYELEGGSSKYARVTVENRDGKRYIYEFVFGNEKISATPREQSNFTSQAMTPLETNSFEAKPGERTTGTESLSESACVTTADIARVPSLNKYIGNDPSIFYSHSVFFLPDSLEYPYTGTSTLLNETADYIKSLGNKSFTVEIQGETATDRTTTASINFANQRAQKLNSELLSRGVSSSKIKVLSPNTDNTKSNLTGESISRTVTVMIRKGC